VIPGLLKFLCKMPFTAGAFPNHGRKLLNLHKKVRRLRLRRVVVVVFTFVLGVVTCAQNGVSGPAVSRPVLLQRHVAFMGQRPASQSGQTCRPSGMIAPHMTQVLSGGVAVFFAAISPAQAA